MPRLSLVLESGFEAKGTAFSNVEEDLVELTGFTCLLLLNSCFSVSWRRELIIPEHYLLSPVSSKLVGCGFINTEDLPHHRP